MPPPRSSTPRIAPRPEEAPVRTQPEDEKHKKVSRGHGAVPTKNPILSKEQEKIAKAGFLVAFSDPLAGHVRNVPDTVPTQPFRDVLAPGSVLPHIPRRDEPKAHAPEMAQADNIVFREGILFKGNHPYQPLPLAAQLAQAPRQTLRNWIKNKTEFQGRPLQTCYLESLDRYFVSEESIQRMANRFVKWRDGEAAGPAGPVTIGQSKDHSGFLPTSAAARVLGVSPRTTWLWASHQGKAPTDRPLDVIKCTTSDHFYIREKDVYELKKIIPRSGLQRGRRPQLAP